MGRLNYEKNKFLVGALDLVVQILLLVETLTSTWLRLVLLRDVNFISRLTISTSKTLSFS